MALRQTLCACFGRVSSVCFSVCVCVLCTGPQLDVGIASSSISLLLWCSLVRSSKSSFLCRWGLQGNGNAYLRTHTYTHTCTQFNWFVRILDFSNLILVQIWLFGGNYGYSSKLKCLKGVREKPVFSPEMPTKSTVVKMQWGLSACHCCHEIFLMSPKRQLPGNKNKFTYFLLPSFCWPLLWYWLIFLLILSWFYFLTRFTFVLLVLRDNRPFISLLFLSQLTKLDIFFSYIYGSAWPWNPLSA